jgi:hypothetical protein
VIAGGFEGDWYGDLGGCVVCGAGGRGPVGLGPVFLGRGRVLMVEDMWKGQR